MKTTMKSMLALMAGTMMFAACSNDDVTENINEQIPSALKPMTFTASMEGQGGASRTAIDGLDINWETGDKISIFDGATENNGDQEFMLNAGAGSTSGTFLGTAADATTYYALYPYVASSYESKTVTQAEVKAILEAEGPGSRMLEMWQMIYKDYPEDVEMDISGMISSAEGQATILAYLKGEPAIFKSGPQRNADDQFEDVVLPAEQTATAGSADKKAMLMIAKSEDVSTMEFKNVCAYVKVTPKFDCTAIALRSTDATKYLAGTLTIDYNGGTPTTTVTANGTNEVFLTGTITAGNTYYIAVRPETLNSGFTIEFLSKDKSHYYARTTKNSLGLTRNDVKNLGEFAANGAWSITSPTSGTDTNDHSWKLVSTNPMLKLATAVAGTCYGNADFNTFTWGNDWVLPSMVDVHPLIAAKAISRLGGYDAGTVNFSGLGVLKYMDGISISAKDLWLADIDASDSHRYALDVAINETNPFNNYVLCHVFYKYVGE